MRAESRTKLVATGLIIYARQRRRARAVAPAAVVAPPAPSALPIVSSARPARRRLVGRATRIAAPLVVTAGAREVVRRNRTRLVRAGTVVAFRVVARRYPRLKKHGHLVGVGEAPRPLRLVRRVQRKGAEA